MLEPLQAGPVLLLLLAVAVLVNSIAHDSLHCEQTGNCPDASHYVLTLVKRDDTLANQIAQEHGMQIKGEPFLDSRYFLQHLENTSRRKKRSAIEAIRGREGVVHLIEDRPRIRTKRDYSKETLHGPINKRQAVAYRKLEIPRLPFPDPLYQDQWYLIGRAVGGYDMNLREAWLLGYAGRNVSISILDDGIQRDHLDLAQNYDPLASTDINDHDDDPTPQNNGDNKHGTRCAGEVAAVAGNNLCGVGVAFHSKIGGVRMLDGPVSDSVEAASLNLNQNHIDIYSASWGPEDDGKTFDGPGNLAQEAFYRGIKQGRAGKGNIFVWASGNGGSRQDSCSADGYTTSIYTLSISSATYDNHRPWYLEECPSTIASTYSSANINQPAIVTVDVPNGCTKMHTGTSASAPLAAGIIALALEANPSLTWRDTQHIVLRTANPTPLLNNAGWSINGVGKRISNKFGYGLMDAGALVKLAKVWTIVPEQHMCTYEYSLDSPRPRPIQGRFQLNFSMEVGGCVKGTPVLYLEHVQVITTIRFAKRGDLKLTLFSPMGTQSVLLPPRPQDFNQNGFHKWPFLSVQMWGEDPRGVWTLMVESISTNPQIGGMFSDWTLLLYGTEEPAQPNDPQHNPLSPVHRNQQVIGQQSFGGVQNTNNTFVPTTEVEPSFTFGDLKSAGDCHVECLVGCTEPHSAAACFSCKHFTQSLRNRAGFKCVEHCEQGFFGDGDKCKKCSSECQTCSQAEQCTSCHGALLLIDVPALYAHSHHHGKCVDTCPQGLVKDYTNLIQAKCVLKKNPCSQGYYENLQELCVVCDVACATCHGAMSTACDKCAAGYANHTLGYCRPCCPVNSTAYECEDCSYLFAPAEEEGPQLGTFFWVVGMVLSGAFLIFIVSKLCCDKSSVWCTGLCGGKPTDLEYTPLKTANEGKERFGGGNISSLDYTDDEEEEETCPYEDVKTEKLVGRRPTTSVLSPTATLVDLDK